MKVVKVENYQVVPDDELLLLKPFRTLYKADRSQGKQKFLDFLCIVYYVYDPRSDYSYILDDDERLEEVCKQNGFSVPKFNEIEKQCIDMYVSASTTTSLELLKSTKITINNVKKAMESFRFDDCDPDKKANSIKAVAGAAALMPKLVKDLQDTERLVAKEIEEAGRARGGNDSKSLMDDGILL